MTIYLDNEYRCHIQNDGTMREVETGFFDGKCAEFIEGYQFIPDGETWTREDGEVFAGEMAAPWKDYEQLAMCQTVYERMVEQQAELNENLAIIAGEVPINDEE